MAKYITSLFVIICMSLASTGYTEEKKLEKYLLNNIKTTMIDVNATGSRGSTLLHWAARKGYPTIVQYLIEKGADTTRFDHYGTTPIQAAIDGMTPQTGKIVHLLQEAINQKGKDGSDEIYEELVVSTNKHMKQNTPPSTNTYTPPKRGRTAKEVVKAKNLEIKLLKNKIDKLQKSSRKNKSSKSEKEKSDKIINSLNSELEETKAKLAKLAKENKKLKGQVSTVNLFDYYKINYLFSYEALNK
ncbi:MAG: ankyrin repeat domain-containing protein [Magnetococcales bacterium]|nr:ankyrin repeat domain-containing protein [Magnetococcales bacterium]